MANTIYIVGDMKLQNSVMAAYLASATGISCEAIDEASRIPDRQNGAGEGKRLILWDCGGTDLETCLSNLSKNRRENSGRDLVGLFNLQRGAGVEEDSLGYGVSGIFYRGDSIDQLIKGIQAILEGELWLSRKIMTRYILKNHTQHVAPAGEEAGLLSRREKEILAMVGAGVTNDEIADKLCISRHTVKTHLYNIFKKIKATNRFQAALWAAKNLM